MTSYILHVSLLLGLGFILYQVLLKKETFYSLNRMVLSSYIILAFALPLIHIPQEWSLQYTDQIESSSKENTTNNKLINTPIKENKSTLSVDNSIDNNSETTDIVSNENQQKNEPTVTSGFMNKANNFIAQINWANALKWTYLIGLGIFLINFLVQFSILLYYRYKFPTLKDGPMTIVEMEGDKAPFSFLNMIYINPTKYDYDTYEQILAHEKIHITKWHSFDIFLSELALIVLWFNPFAWFYRKAVEHNLEYLTDQEMLASGANAEVYQMNLLKVSVPELPLSLSTNYNQSFLKKRIHMMNAKKSSARSTWKYLFILPILGLTVTLFNPIVTTAQETEDNYEKLVLATPEKPTDANHPIQPLIEPITPTFTLPNTMDTPQSQGDVKLIDSKNQLNNSIEAMTDLSMFELSEEVELSVSKTANGLSFATDDGRTFKVDVSSGKTSVTSATEVLKNEGRWEGELRDNRLCIGIQKGLKGKDYYWNSSECFNASDFNPNITKNSKGDFSLTRDAGKLILKGEFVNGNGEGKYEFTPNKKYIATAKSQGYTISEDKLIHFFMSGMDVSFFSFLKSNGYKNVDEDEILALAIHNVNKEYIKNVNSEFMSAGYDQPTVDELVALKIHDVDLDYIKSFGKALYKDLDVDQIIAAAIHDVDPKYISEFKALGYPDLTFDNLIAASIHDVDVEYVKQLKGAGFEDLTFDNLIAAAIHDVDPEYIKSFKAAGMDVTFDNMIAAAIHDIDVDYIKEFKDAGLNDLSFDNLIQAGIHDVDVTFLKEAKKHGFDLTFDELIAASIHDVNLDYLEAFSNSGLKNLTFDNMIAASIHDVDPQFIKDFNALGYTDLTFDNLINAAIHDVDIEYIKTFKEIGFPDLTFDNFIAAAIHDVEPAYMKEIKGLNIKDLTFDDIIAFNIHDIEIDHIKGFKSMGFNLPPDKLIEAGIHDVTPEFIKKMQKEGHENLQFEEYVRLKMQGF